MRINEPGPSFTNKLMHSSSPYLRQHARNPVFWYPWGEEALAEARAQDKPILLSIGYSTCYWCHVMEREVFENPSIAALMNRCFINIKVDREEHPQLDEVYMTARQLMTHEGGWPNNLFLTPDLKPFHAGGTYGAVDAYGKPGFPRLVEWLNAEWLAERSKLEALAQRTTELMQQFLVAKPAHAVSDFSPMIAQAREALAKHHDIQSGGFFQAPKFPQENYLQFLLAHHEATQDATSLEMAVFSLSKMAAGGINDQVGCGFHRYAVDKDWFVPHFEKMLYTQALLAKAYTEATRITGNDYLADVAKSICEFVTGPLTDGSGAFYAAIDAESDGVEGAYYAWTTQELEKILTPEEVAFFIHHYGLADIPHFPGHKHPKGEVILLRQPMDALAKAQDVPYVQVASMCGSIMNKLLAARNMHRIAPNLDHKIITGWNGLMIDALAAAGRVFSNPHYIERAWKAADYLLQYAVNDAGHLMRCVTFGRAEHAATLEDYAYLIKGLLSLHESSIEDDMLIAALQLLATAEELFEDNAADGFFSTQEDDVVPVRVKNGDDSTLPNANAVMAQNYVTLYRLTGEAHYQEKAQKIVQYFLGLDSRMWIEYTSMLTAAMMVSHEVKAVPITQMPDAQDEVVHVSCKLAGNELRITLNIEEGWYIQPDSSRQPNNTATRILIQAPGVDVLECRFPEPTLEHGRPAYAGGVTVRATLALPEVRPEIRVMLQYHPCKEDACFAQVKNVVIV